RFDLDSSADFQSQLLTSLLDCYILPLLYFVHGNFILQQNRAFFHLFVVESSAFFSMGLCNSPAADLMTLGLAPAAFLCVCSGK
ncbi:MAG: hypothetical protein Q4C03_06985, partial [bacterium]|nr:hypothetical protein [bacterium]